MLNIQRPTDLYQCLRFRQAEWFRYPSLQSAIFLSLSKLLNPLTQVTDYSPLVPTYAEGGGGGGKHRFVGPVKTEN
jgi:hypothetical protein